MNSVNDSADKSSVDPTVLIVDDVPDVRLGYRYVLQEAGFQIVEAFSAEEALHIIAEHRVDLALVDLFMPGSMDGIGLIGAVKEMPPPRPALIAMSGAPHRAFRSSLQSAKYLGADQTFQKPIEPGLLVRTIRSLIGGGPALLNQQ